MRIQSWLKNWFQDPRHERKPCFTVNPPDAVCVIGETTYALYRCDTPTCNDGWVSEYKGIWKLEDFKGPRR